MLLGFLWQVLDLPILVNHGPIILNASRLCSAEFDQKQIVRDHVDGFHIPETSHTDDILPSS